MFYAAATMNNLECIAVKNKDGTSKSSKAHTNHGWQKNERIRKIKRKRDDR